MNPGPENLVPEEMVENGLRALFDRLAGPSPAPEVQAAIVAAAARAAAPPPSPGGGGGAGGWPRWAMGGLAAGVVLAAGLTAGLLLARGDDGPVATAPPSAATTVAPVASATTSGNPPPSSTTAPPVASSSTTPPATTSLPATTTTSTTTAPPATTTTTSSTTTSSTATSTSSTTTSTTSTTTSTTTPDTTTTTTTLPGFDAPSCESGAWSADHKPEEADPNGLVVVLGVAIDFLTDQEVGQSGSGLHGIELISDPRATVWVRQLGRWFPVTPADLVWYTNQTPGGPFHPIELFGVCLLRNG